MKASRRRVRTDSMSKPITIASTLLAMAGVLLPGCARAVTRVTAFKDPEFAERVYQRLLVTAEDVSLDVRNAVEIAVAEELNHAGTEALVGASVLLPTRKYSEEQKAGLLRERAVEGELAIRLTHEAVIEQFVPPSTTIHGHVYRTGRTLTYSSYAHDYGGYYISRPKLQFEARLIDVATGRTAWIASAVTLGTSSSRLRDLARSLAEKLVRTLADDGLVAAPAE
jgi:hypothetical protein